MSRVVAITGANGFVGRALVRDLTRSGFDVRQIVRSARFEGELAVGDIDGGTDWSAALIGADAVIHCAARVHVMRESVGDPLGEFRRTNVEGTRQLAEQAAQAGVRRLVFLSSVKVNGESTWPGHPFKTSDPPMPVDAYGRSKWEAEQALSRIKATTGLDVVVIRPPLVYGPGVGANFLRLIRLVSSGVPLPLGSVENRRSMIGLDNLTHLVRHCLGSSAAQGGTFFASDCRDLSTPELIELIACAQGRAARLFPMPSSWLQRMGRLTARADMLNKLIGTLQIDMSATCQTLGWRPPHSVEEQVRSAVLSSLRR